MQECDTNEIVDKTCKILLDAAANTLVNTLQDQAELKMNWQILNENINHGFIEIAKKLERNFDNVKENIDG